GRADHRVEVIHLTAQHQLTEPDGRQRVQVVERGHQTAITYRPGELIGELAQDDATPRPREGGKHVHHCDQDVVRLREAGGLNADYQITISPQRRYAIEAALYPAARPIDRAKRDPMQVQREHLLIGLDIDRKGCQDFDLCLWKSVSNGLSGDAEVLLTTPERRSHER